MPSKISVPKGLDAGAVEALIDVRFPQVHSGGRIFTIETLGDRHGRVRMKQHERNTRPGGTVAGSAMFALADFAIYVAVIGELGEPGIDAVTTNLSINFLAKPEPRDLIASVRLIRVGRRLAVGDAELYSEGITEMVAHAVGTYALPR